MFTRFTKDLLFYYKREEWKYVLNEDNLKYKPKFLIYRYEKLMGKNNFINFKYWIFKRWILKNFAYTQDFIHKFYKYVKKLDLELNSKEQEFIYNVEEVNFTLWRPLKILPIYFDLEPKEKCHFKNNDVNLHKLDKDNKISFVCKGVLLITNKRVILDGIIDNQETPKTFSFPLPDIKKVEYVDVGVKITVKNTDYLIREQNNMVILALLYRALGKKKVVFDIYKLPENISFFNFK
ncbi:hypothetical protein [Spiroplasma sp. DGKH1]|uniref:hypothetical protein n=1 Tax=Spiroplasma sp. DGKH1 TaxID=3050074 RepID=UPI0034C5E567